MFKKLFGKRGSIPHADFVKKVNAFALEETSMEELKARLSDLKIAKPEQCAEPYAIIRELIRRHTGLTLFDTQLAAAYAMQLGHIAELPTGEGKTLSAVVAAVCYARMGNQVHILVFNDYLAKRDFSDNCAIFADCGVTSAYIGEHSTPEERKTAYACDVVYIAAKEAGFDFLRDFLCDSPDELVFPKQQVVIIDEADSILIDEARIPLVLAGEKPDAWDEVADIYEAAAALDKADVDLNRPDNQVWLTERGIASMEERLGIDNLYDAGHADVLAAVNAVIEARFLLERDKHYLVKGDEIQVIDESTGRVAVGRKFPDLLHHAVEIKEGVHPEQQAMIYNSTTIQAFVLQYETKCGMTGTAKSSANELFTMYGLDVDVVPPHVPCIRVDHTDAVFEEEEEKEHAILAEIRAAHAKGQPVLLGTQSVGESERYAAMLEKLQLPHVVLNARNDEEEAGIIARAGEPGRITVSTNMAGRGVDIKLGGPEEAQKAEVAAAGGLYVISTSLNRSIRTDNQLRGRAGRQGDPGESKFFFCLTDENLAGHFPSDSMARYDEKRLMDMVRRAQKAEEGKDAEARYMLERYGYIIEEQRRTVTAWRTGLLVGEKTPDILLKKDADLHQSLVEQVGEAGVARAEVQLTLHAINRRWASYLEAMENVRDGIHLMVVGGKSPLEEYQKIAVSAFDDMVADIESDVLSGMQKYEITEAGIDMEAAGLKGATTTWTYMIDDRSSQFSRIPHLIKTLSNAVTGSIFERDEEDEDPSM